MVKKGGQNKIPHKFIDGVEHKRCNDCKEYKILTEFGGNKHKSRWDGLQARCLPCKRAYCKKWKEANPEKVIKSRKICARRRVLNGKRKMYRKSKYENDSQFRLLENLRTRLYIALKRRGIRKTTATMKLCGCSLEKLKQHLESQFYEGMSWEKKNFHIDHMEPCALFNLEDEEEQRKCFHYTNLKPEWPSQNMSDGGRRKWNMEWNGERWIVHGRL